MIGSIHYMRLFAASCQGYLVVRGQKLEGRPGLNDAEMHVSDEGVVRNTVERYAL